MAESARAELAEPPLPLSPVPSGVSLDLGTPLERLRLLRALLPPVEAALGVLTCRPDGKLQPQTAAVPAAQSRGSRAAVRSVACGPHTPRAARIEPAAGGAGYVDDLRPSLSTDTPANRLVVALLFEMEREARVLAALASFCGEEAEAACAAALAERLRQWRMTPLLAALPLPDSCERRRLLAHSGAARAARPIALCSAFGARCIARCASIGPAVPC